VTALDDANLRDIADDVRIIEASVDEYLAALEMDGYDADVMLDSLKQQNRVVKEMRVPLDRLITQLGRC
jgi:hypothetical protein